MTIFSNDRALIYHFTAVTKQMCLYFSWNYW